MRLVSSTLETSFPSAVDTLTFQFEDLPRQLRRIFDEALQGAELSRTQWRLLAYVLRQEGMTQTELARLLEIERASAGWIRAVALVEERLALSLDRMTHERDLGGAIHGASPRNHLFSGLHH